MAKRIKDKSSQDADVRIADLSKKEEVDKLAQDIMSQYKGGVDVLVNNAASLGPIDYKKGDNMGQGPLDGMPLIIMTQCGLLVVSIAGASPGLPARLQWSPGCGPWMHTAPRAAPWADAGYSPSLVLSPIAAVGMQGTQTSGCARSTSTCTPSSASPGGCALL